jgi:hypothetical protein
MPETTNRVTTECAKDVVFAIDVLDENRHLYRDPIPLTDSLNECGCGPQKCAHLQQWVNKRRALVGKAPLPAKAIGPETTIEAVIDHVCA